MYADYIVLFATSAADLQRLVDVLHEFCVEVGLSINADKSVCMVFSSEGRRLPSPLLHIQVNGTTVLRQVQTFKYLGVQFHETLWLKRAGDLKAADASRAAGALWRGAQERQMICRDTLLRLYRTLVLPPCNILSCPIQ